MLIDLSGQIERITYNNEENGFTIAKVKVYGQRDLVTIIGNLMAPTPGEILKMRGEWANHPKFGEQFKVVQYETKVPATITGIQKYLGSGLIKGLGPVMAKRIVKKFGDRTLEVIENQIFQLSNIEGIGKKRIAMIQNAWDEQKEIRDVMIFLQAHGVSSGYAAKIFKEYGNKSIAVVKGNPFRLATDIFGIGFVTADSIAEKLGFPKNSDQRIEAGILYVLHKLSDEGHVYYPYEELIIKSREILGVEREAVVKAFGILAADKKIVFEDLNTQSGEIKENNKAVYLTKFHLCETYISDRLKSLVLSCKSIRNVDTEKAIDWVQKQLSITLAKNQVSAICSCLKEKVIVITGGPGTGKTTIINAILKIFSMLKVRTLLTAPTGRAAKRMSETTGYEARTIHRLLEFSFAKGGFQKTEERPLGCDLIVVDEASMIDTVLMYHLLKAVPLSAILILVGDVNQLPSVGAGNILKDIIESNAVTVTWLNEIFRQAKKSQIIVNAHKINRGIIPSLGTSQLRSQENDFYLIQQEDPDRVVEIILELVKIRIPQRFGFDPVDDIQVLTPMHKGVAGAVNLNRELQKILNPGQEGVMRGEQHYRVSDKVMQVRNNYDKEVFNGDIGRIAQIYPENQQLAISFDGREVTLDFSDLDEVVLAYAVSVHKSQGSEFPVVIIPVLTQHYILLQRNLIYTAVTRGQKLVVMVGARKALAIGVKNDKTKKRFTYLSYRLA
ncbi:MAG: ATP-dependent RecD-like DNA helicase [Desulfobacterales bacterium]|nr:ATP-dependent RecD-like DNA helicase [Desulfobacterales bacterium]